MIFLDEPLRLKEQGEAVELEFRESMEHRLEKGYLLPGQTGLSVSGAGDPGQGTAERYRLSDRPGAEASGHDHEKRGFLLMSGI